MHCFYKCNPMRDLMKAYDCRRYQSCTKLLYRIVFYCGEVKFMIVNIDFEACIRVKDFCLL